MTSVKALVNVGGGVVGAGLLLTDDRRLVVCDQRNEAVASYELRDGNFSVIPGTPSAPAHVRIGDDVHLRVQYVGGALDDFFFVLNHEVRSKRAKSATSAFYGVMEASWKAQLLRLSTNVPAEMYGPFGKLADALAVLRLKPSLCLQVWSRETTPGTGARDFFLASYGEFWRHYAALESGDRCHYEVVREGLPAKLYLDVEYDRTLNKELEGQPILEQLVSLMEEFLRLHFHDAFDAECVVLESPYDHKYSRHILFPQVVLENNVVMGHLMAAFLEYAQLRRDTPAADLLFAKSEKKEHQFVCDMAVYSRNRNFRLPYSSKLGKNSFLATPSAGDSLDRGVFMRSLVCNVAENSRVLQYEVPVAVSGGGGRSLHTAQGPLPQLARGSPFPEVDRFVRENLLRGEGFVRRLQFYPSSNTICYHVGGTRFCANVGRQHKSNGVYYVASVGARHLVQRCLDPDCRGFSSQPVPIPAWAFRPVDWNAESGQMIRAMIESGDICRDDELMEMLSAFEGSFIQQKVATGEFLSDQALLDAAAELGY